MTRVTNGMERRKDGKIERFAASGQIQKRYQEVYFCGN
jgi:hypothetical protein